MTETEIREEMAAVSAVLNQLQVKFSDLNQEWLMLVSRRVKLVHMLRQFEIARS